MQINIEALKLKTPLYLTYVLLGYILYLGLNLAISNIGFVPDYDALMYVDSAMRLNYSLFYGDHEALRVSGAAGQAPWVGLPFTNTLDVLVMSLLHNIVNHHIVTWMLHSAYILCFVYFFKKIFSPSLTFIFLVWSVSHIYFLHQYTSFISEMKVGMFLALFVAYLFHSDVSKHLKSLFWIAAILLLLRTINILFILPLVVTYVAMRLWVVGDRGDIKPVLKTIGLVFLVLSPLLLHELRYLLPYIYKGSVGDTAQNWKDMAGTQGKLELLQAYISGVASYSSKVRIVVILTACIAVALLFTPVRARLSLFAQYLVASGAVFAVLMQAQSNNIMVVYWVYILLGMLVVCLLGSVLKDSYLVIVACLVAPLAFGQNYSNFLKENNALGYKEPFMQLSRGLVESIASVEKPIIFQNYSGIGSLDVNGIEIQGKKLIGHPDVNSISYNTTLMEYITAVKQSNVAFVANSNFAWPDYLGLNHKTEELAEYIRQNTRRLGLIKYRTLYFNSDPSKYIDVYMRPTMKIGMEYMQFGDNWIDRKTSIVIESVNPSVVLDNYQIQLDVMLPAVDSPGFSLPLRAALRDADNKLVGTVFLDRAGTHKIIFPLDGLHAGLYSLEFDKSFTPADDARELVVQHLGSTLKFVEARVNGLQGINSSVPGINKVDVQ